MRRRFSRKVVFGFVSALATVSFGVCAADFPSRPVRLIAATTPGGILDVAARILAPSLEKQFKQSVFVENRGGAGAQVAASAVVNAPHDGYTLLVSTSVALVPVFMKTPLATLKDLAPISLIAESPLLMVVPKELPSNSMAELFAHVKANPGKINYPTVGAGAALSLYYEFWKAKEGLQMQEIAYPGPGPILTAMLRGDVLMAFFSVGFAKSGIESGKIKAIATSGKARLKEFPNVQTFAEAGYPWLRGTMVAMHVAAGTPGDLVGKIHSAVVAAGKDPEVVKRMEGLSFIMDLSTPEELRKREESDANWALDVARTANMRAQ